MTFLNENQSSPQIVTIFWMLRHLCRMISTVSKRVGVGASLRRLENDLSQRQVIHLVTLAQKDQVLMNGPDLKDSLIGEEWMALRQIAFGAEPAQIPRSVRTRLEALGLIARDDYGLMLTETGRRMMETPEVGCRGQSLVARRLT
jgi:hypothetical protein